MNALTIRHTFLLLVPGLAFVSFAYGQGPGLQARDTEPREFISVIEFPRQTIVFAPTRSDMTVGRVTFAVFFPNREAIRLNGAKPDSTFTYVDLKQLATNRFELAPLKIEFSTNGQSGPLCMSIKAWFNEVSNQYDSLFYQNLDDRYALVSYCTSSPASSEARSRFKQNRVATVKEFKEILAKPMVMRLKQTPLRKEWR
jgi:hypothetical protein